MIRKNIFISYSHRDQDYLDRLLVHLKPLERERIIDVWADTKLKSGDNWRREIEERIQRASVAILLVTADFLASDFIIENELSPLLLKAQKDGARIIPVIIKPCRFERDKLLRQFQSFNKPSETFVRMSHGKQEKFYAALTEKVEDACCEINT